MGTVYGTVHVHDLNPYGPAFSGSKSTFTTQSPLPPKKGNGHKQTDCKACGTQIFSVEIFYRKNLQEGVLCGKGFRKKEGC